MIAAEKRNHVMQVMDTTGDTKTVWDADNPDEVANAKRTFEDLKKKGYKAFYAGKDGKKGELMLTFDESASKMILVPPVVGG